MIFTQKYINQIDSNTNVYNKIIKIFINISKYYFKERTINKYLWFHIHISKAGGTTLRSLFYNIFNAKHNPYLTTSQNLLCKDQYNYLTTKIIAKSTNFHNNSYNDKNETERNYIKGYKFKHFIMNDRDLDELKHINYILLSISFLHLSVRNIQKFIKSN